MNARAPIHVSGGVGGIAANRAELLGLAHAYRDAADRLALVAFVLRAVLDELGAGLLLLGHGAALDRRAQLAAVEAVSDALTAARHADDRTALLGRRVLAAALGYRWGSDLLEDIAGPSLWDELCSVGGDTWALVRDGPQKFAVDHPGAVDAIVNDGGPILAITPLAPLIGAVEAYRALAAGWDGHGHAVATGAATTGPAPRSLADLAEDLAQRDEGPGGSIDVRIVTGTDGSRHVIVDVTGIDTLSPYPTGTDPADLVACARAIDGRSTAYEQGVFDAMRQAGVRPGDPVLVVGHSLGGMIAVNVARSAARSGAYRVTHVVTAGSPVGRTVGGVPASVQVLAMEGSHDVVPHLDGRANPDRPNVVTVTGAVGDDRTVSGDHDSRTVYEPLARAIDASHDRSVRAFLDGADGFLSGTTVTTHTYRVVRS